MFTNIGHQHPKVVAAIAEQAPKLCTIAPQHVNAARSEAARLIAERTSDLNRVFFTNGGADAVEHAVRMARLHTGRYKVLSRYRSYHGGTDTAINLTGDTAGIQATTPAAASSTSTARSVPLVVPRGERAAETGQALGLPRSPDPARGGRPPSRIILECRFPAPAASSDAAAGLYGRCARTATSTASSSSPTRVMAELQAHR